MNFQRFYSHSISTDHITTVCHVSDDDVNKRNISVYWEKLGQLAEEGAKAEKMCGFN